MRYYTDKYICRLADSVYIEPALFANQTMLKIDTSNYAACEKEVAKVIASFESQISQRSNSSHLLQYCHDIKECIAEISYRISEITEYDSSQRDKTDDNDHELFVLHASVFKAFDVVDALIDSIANYENFSTEERALAASMLIEVINCRSFEQFVTSRFVNYALCRILYLIADDCEDVYDQFEAVRCADILIEKTQMAFTV